MGGGGGGSGRSGIGDVSELLKKAREEIRKGTATTRPNVFLSFAFEDINEVQLLRGHAKNENSDIDFNDWSVREPFDSTRAPYIKGKIGERIQQSSTTVVYLSPATAASSWVEWEVEESIRLDKRVIAVHPGDAPPRPEPTFISKHQIKVVRWSDLGAELAKG